MTYYIVSVDIGFIIQRITAALHEWFPQDVINKTGWHHVAVISSWKEIEPSRLVEVSAQILCLFLLKTYLWNFLDLKFMRSFMCLCIKLSAVSVSLSCTRTIYLLAAFYDPFRVLCNGCTYTLLLRWKNPLKFSCSFTNFENSLPWKNFATEDWRKDDL